MAYLDDMSIVGKLTPAAGAFRRLCVDDEGVRSIGLEPRLPKCGIYGGDKEQVAAEAAKLRITHQLDGFTAVGTPLGSAECVSNALGRRAATVETLVDTLVQRPLSVQSQFLLLRASLQARMVQPHAGGASRGAGDAHASQGRCSVASGGGRARLSSRGG